MNQQIVRPTQWIYKRKDVCGGAGLSALSTVDRQRRNKDHVITPVYEKIRT